MLALFKKELLTYFITPFGYVFSGFFLLVSGIVFVVYNLAGTKSDINGMLGVLHFTSIFVFPLLTMKLLAEEKKAGTDVLLFTAPVSSTAIILGKYLAALVVFTVTLLLTFIYPFIISLFTKLPAGIVLGSYLGFFFLGAAYIAVCMFASSLTDNQVLASILGCGFLLGLILTDMAAGLLPFPLAKALLKAFSLSDRYDEISTGIIRLAPFVCFISFAVVFLTIATLLMGSRYGHRPSNNKGKDGLSNTFSTIIRTTLLAGIILLANSISGQLPWMFDMSLDKVFTLSAKTKEVVTSLEKNVSFMLFTKNGNEDRTISALLDEYLKIGKGKITYRYVDAEKDPLQAKKYDLKNEGIANGMILITCDGKIKKLHDFDILRTDEQLPGTSFYGEQQFTSAIINLTSTRLQEVFFLEGHEEMDPDNNLFKVKYKLESESYVTGKLNLLKTSSIPETADVIIVASPKRDLNNYETALLKDYLDKGGRMLVMIDVLEQKTSMPHFTLFLHGYGIDYRNSFVIEESSDNYFSNNKLFIVPRYENHVIVNKLKENKLGLLFPFSGNLDISISPPENVSVVPLLKSSENSFIRFDFTNEAPTITTADKKGPAVIAVAITLDNTDLKYKESKLVITYNAKFIEDSLIEMQGNYDYFMSALNWVEGKQDSISIRPKMLGSMSLVLTSSQFMLLAIISIACIPAVIFLAGFVVWIKRKGS